MSEAIKNDFHLGGDTRVYEPILSSCLLVFSYAFHLPGCSRRTGKPPGEGLAWDQFFHNGSIKNAMAKFSARFAFGRWSWRAVNLKSQFPLVIKPCVFHSLRQLGHSGSAYSATLLTTIG